MADTTYYVSKSTDNGYVVGDDGNAGTSKAAPFLTLGAASTAAYAVAGNHAIIINDGSYVGTDIAAQQYWLFGGSPTCDSITVRPEVSGSVTIIPNVVTGGIRFSSGTGMGGKTFTFEDLIIGRASATDAGVNANYNFGMTAAAATPVNFNLTRCTMYDAAFYNIDLAVANVQANLTVTDCISTTSHSNMRSTIRASAVAAGSLVIDELTISKSNWDNSAFQSVLWDASAAGVTANVRGVTGSVTVDPASVGVGSISYGVVLVNCDNAIIADSSLTFTGTSAVATWSVKAFVCYCNDATLTAAKQKIYNCHVTAVDMDAGGYAIGIDADISDGVANKSDGSIIKECSFTGDAAYQAGNGHGVGVTENDNCEISGCAVSFADIGFLSKTSATNLITGNLAYSCGGGSSNVCYYNKGGTNDNWFNNTAIIDANSDSMAFLAGIEGATNTTGAEFNANYIAVLADTTQKVINIQASQTATFDYNYYTVIGSLPADPFSYQATNYASAAAWISARETNGVDLGTTNPMTDSANGDYSPALGSALVGTSPIYDIGAPTGANGEPIASFERDIGGIQSIHNASHPSNA